MKGRLYLATLAAYVTADSISSISGAVGSSVGAALDPGALVVPFCAAFAVAFPAWGRLADRIAAGRALAISLCGLAAGGLMLAAADSELTVIAARALEGAAAAGVPPTAQALLAAEGGDKG